MDKCPDKIEPIQVICEQAETCRTNLYCFHTKPHQHGEECLTPCAYMTAPCIPKGFPMPDEKVADCDHKTDTGEYEGRHEKFLSPYVKLGRQIQFLVKENQRLKNEIRKAYGELPIFPEDSP